MSKRQHTAKILLNVSIYDSESGKDVCLAEMSQQGIKAKEVIVIKADSKEECLDKVRKFMAAGL